MPFREDDSFSDRRIKFNTGELPAGDLDGLYPKLHDVTLESLADVMARKFERDEAAAFTEVTTPFSNFRVNLTTGDVLPALPGTEDHHDRSLPWPKPYLEDDRTMGKTLLGHDIVEKYEYPDPDLKLNKYIIDDRHKIHSENLIEPRPAYNYPDPGSMLNTFRDKEPLIGDLHPLPEEGLRIIDFKGLPLPDAPAEPVALWTRRVRVGEEIVLLVQITPPKDGPTDQ